MTSSKKYILKANQIIKILKDQKAYLKDSHYAQTFRILKTESDENEKQGFGSSLLLFKMPESLRKEIRQIRMNYLLAIKR